MDRSRSYTDDQFIEAVKNNTSVSQVLSDLGIRPTGGNYKVFHKRVSELGIDTSHLKGKRTIEHLRWSCQKYLLRTQPIRALGYVRDSLRKVTMNINVSCVVTPSG